MSETAEKKKPEDTDVEAILPAVGEVTVNGVPCVVRRLKTREFLSLMNVLTSGLGPALADVKLDFSDADSVTADLSALMLLALPNAVDEFTVFLRTVVEAKDGRQTAKVAAYLMDNPDVDVLLEVFEVVATQEKDDLVVLAGKAQAMWARVASLFTTKKK